jgi:HD-GYP domain-containing protein (c-di-GMP phosphodiesterase class II)
MDVVVAGQVVEITKRDALLVAVPTISLAHDALEPYLERIAEGRAGLILVGVPPTDFLDTLPERAVVALVDGTFGDDALYLTFKGMLERIEMRLTDDRRRRTLDRYRYELGELVEIARALSQERDTSRLLNLILEKSRFITGADAGSIYVLEGDDPDILNRQLHFKLSQNDSCEFESSEFTMPVSTRSIAGAAAVTRSPINIPDVYAIPDETPYGFDSSFDEKLGYHTKSMIALPMISAEDDVIGVIQLINKKKHPEKLLLEKDDFQAEVVEFGEREEELLQTLASQAGIALENALLYEEINRIFEGFVRASVQAIEQRDPTTSGHSLRVSVLSCRLAEIVDTSDVGVYADTSFTRRELKELEYASLLHDFGKIGVREKVLVKAKKLYPHELAAVRARFDFLLKTAEVEMLRKKMELVQSGASKETMEEAELAYEKKRGELQGAYQLVLQANEPTVMSEGDFTAVGALAERSYVGPDGEEHPLLSEVEVSSLQVTKGSLNEPEIEEIRSHVTHTFDFLSRIPWGKTMRYVPQIAGAHHEKLNGSGYPRGVTAEEIPLQSKIMTIADIYDALTARDRPYKKAMPVERALDILGYEVKDNHIDGELVRLFTEAKVFEAVEDDLEY